MMDAMHRCEGMVNQVMGDGMALFGAPIARRPRGPRLLCRAPNAGIRQSVRRGGLARARREGADPRRAIGETTHLAARMEQAARPGTILIAPATLNRGRRFHRREVPGSGAGERPQRAVEVDEL